MPKKKQQLSLSDELRQAVERCGLSRYSIWQQTGIDQGTLSKFMAGDRGLSIESIDKLADLLGLHICTADAERSRSKGRRKTDGERVPSSEKAAAARGGSGGRAKRQPPR